MKTFFYLIMQIKMSIDAYFMKNQSYSAKHNFKLHDTLSSYMGFENLWASLRFGEELEINKKKHK